MNRWPLHKARFWEYAPFFRVLLPFAAGIVVYYSTGMRWPTLYSAAAAGVLLMVYTSVALRKQPILVTALISFLSLQMALMSGGYCIATVADESNGIHYFDGERDSSAAYIAVITDIPTEKTKTWKLKTQLINRIKNDTLRAVTGRCFLYITKDELPMLLQRGDTIIIPGNWQPVTNAGNPAEFDYAGYCRRNNIGYQQFCRWKDIRLYSARDDEKQSLTRRVNEWTLAVFEQYITDKRALGLIQAMLTGEEVNLDAELRQSFADTGIVHIIAISGGNIMLFFTVISWLLWWVRHKKHLWVKYVIALPLVWFYVLMAGASPSAMRAAVMFSLLAWGLMFSKNNNGLNQLFATTFILLCGQPAWLFATGFQLSFTAVLSIILFYPGFNGLVRISIKKKIPKWFVKNVRETTAASLAAEVLTAPLVIFYFHSFPVLFILSNVLAFIFMGIALILGLILLAASGLPVLAGFIGCLIKYLVEFFDWLMGFMKMFNPTSFHFLQLSVLETALLYLVIAGVAYCILRKSKPALFTAMAACCLLLALLCVNKAASLAQEQFVVYNIGKTTHIEYISGDRFQVVRTDTSATATVAYATGPAHIRWQAWRRSNDDTGAAITIAGKTVLILDAKREFTGSFPVDYLVVNYDEKAGFEALAHTFSPSVIIYCGHELVKEGRHVAPAAVAGTRIHIPGRDGAFVRH
ncbi:MAG: ComEC/Rec2 family competence protein [Taibaiella sp.]|nr:ComEC/Rec2 family competence protein [Taibaiella sp.]